jgi:hypothetical protein
MRCRFWAVSYPQSAVSEPTRLSVPFEAMSITLNQNSVPLSASDGERDQGCGVDSLPVVRQVLVEGRARGHAGLLQLDDHQPRLRIGVDEADQIRPAGLERPGDAELADQQKIIVRRLLPINHAQPLQRRAQQRAGHARKCRLVV